MNFEELKQWTGCDLRLNLARQYTRRLGLIRPKGDNVAGTFFVNGKIFPLNEVRTSLMETGLRRQLTVTSFQEFRANLQQSMQSQMQHIMQQVYFNAIDDLDDVSLYFYDQTTTLPSRNPVINPEEGKTIRFVNVAEMQDSTGVVCSNSGSSPRILSRCASVTDSVSDRCNAKQ